MAPYTLLTAFLAGLAIAQTPGPTKEVHPKLTTYKCTKSGGCKQQNTFVVLDANSHPIYQRNDTSKGCAVGTGVDPVACPDVATCAKNCIIDGVSDYASEGVHTNGSAVTMDLFADGATASPRIYLLGQDQKTYEVIKLNNQEISFEVDLSKLPCGMNGAFYMSEMQAKGGQSKYNPAGAAYGTGYCDAQCFTTSWANGVANVNGSGVCCNELDIWEANARATQVAPHTCTKPGVYLCSGAECGATGVCDKNGCGRNPYRTSPDFYGLGKKVDTSKPFTVVTQFPAINGTLQQVIRKYIQNGTVISDADTTPHNDAFCSATGAKTFMADGAMKGMGEAMSRGMVLTMSIWWDMGGAMNWLDSTVDGAGPCNATEGFPAVVTTVEKAPQVVFSQIKWGDIGSTTTTTMHHS